MGLSKNCSVIIIYTSVKTGLLPERYFYYQEMYRDWQYSEFLRRHNRIDDIHQRNSCQSSLYTASLARLLYEWGDVSYPQSLARSA